MKLLIESVYPRAPGGIALLLLALLPVAYRWEPPQFTANEGYRRLFAGDSGSAVVALRKALIEDPGFPYRWSDLGNALADNGDLSEAAYCYEKSVELGPADPQIALRAMNFQFRAGSKTSALTLGARILRLVPNYDEMIFRSYVRMGVTPGEIRMSGIGANARAAASFFHFLEHDSDKSELEEYWRWIENAGYGDRELARSRADWLLAGNEPGEAEAVWKKYVAMDRASYGSTNGIDNGSFEGNPSGDGFDWVVNPPVGVIALRDGSEHHSGSYSLKLNFAGQDNIDFHHVYQRVWLRPGRYRLSAWLRTEGISTDQGLAVSLVGVQDPPLEVSTSALSGNHGWTAESVEFVTNAPGRLAEVRIVRRRSLDFDNKLRGTVWIDDVALQPID